ncbi:MAG: hypothetical protein IH608_05440 [Proteobacteria bacterium]|nr:hypothetical protein [Pseudomonadota bacterium]
MRRGLVVLILAVGSGLATQGCTYRAWYEGLQERQRQECYESRDESEIQRCVERVNRTTYDEYRKGREAPSGRSE